MMLKKDGLVDEALFRVAGTGLPVEEAGASFFVCFKP